VVNSSLQGIECAFHARVAAPAAPSPLPFPASFVREDAV